MPKRVDRFVRVAVFLVGSAGAVVALVLVPVHVRGWLAGVLAAALAGYLATALPTLLGAAGQSWRRRHGGPPPFTVAVRTMDEDYVVVTEPDRVIEIPASGHGVRLIVTATSSTPVLIVGLRPEIRRRRDVGGTLTRHAAAVPVRRFEILLDGDPPHLRPTDPAQPGFPFQVSGAEVEVFDLVARTEAGDVSWVLMLEWVSGASGGTVQIDLAGEPFRTAGRHAPAVGDHVSQT
jgi:hypothetical protein